MSLMNVPAPSGHRLCRHLRCKEMYYSSTGADDEARANPAKAFADKIFWCMKTYKADGPEGELCGAEECPPTRACYEA